MNRIKAISRNSGVDFRVRTQFAFLADDRTLSCILSGIAGKLVNITGYLQTRLSQQIQLVRLVDGPPDLERQSDLQAVRNVC